MLAYWTAQPLRRSLEPNRIAVISVYTLLLLYFALSLPAIPIAALVLPPLLGLVALVLQRNRRAEPETHALPLPAPVPFARHLWLLLVPTVAIGLYSVAYALDVRAPINVLVYLLLTPLGFALLFVSVWRVWRRGG